jgi:hypothetical protein
MSLVEGYNVTKNSKIDLILNWRWYSKLNNDVKGNMAKNKGGMIILNQMLGSVISVASEIGVVSFPRMSLVGGL